MFDGEYRLHYYAASMWLDLVRRYIVIDRSKPVSNKVILALEELVEERSCKCFSNATDTAAHSPPFELEILKSEWLELHTVLVQASRFQRKCLESDIHVTKGERAICPLSAPALLAVLRCLMLIWIEDTWTSFDPLTTCHTTGSLHWALPKLLCPTNKHHDGCECAFLDRYYGPRPFKCGFLSCHYFRHGFATEKSRDSHERHHDRPWKCSVPSCEYFEIGFLSRRMRDEHLGSHHMPAESETKLVPHDIDADELQPLLFDLINLDKVDAVKSLLPRIKGLKDSIQEELTELAASFGSQAMFQLLVEAGSSENLLDLLVKPIRAGNIETFRYLLSKLEGRGKLVGLMPITVLQALIEAGSVELFEIFGKFLSKLTNYSRSKSRRFVSAARNAVAIKATANCPLRENFLISLWDQSVWEPVLAVRLLISVSSTTASVPLAKALIGYGANVDERKNETSMTPLKWACKRSSPQVANFVTYLLYQGATSNAWCNISKREISDEKGAREISRWIGIPWEELVEKVKADRERGYCPPEYR